MTGTHSIGALVSAVIDYRGKTPPKTDGGVPLVTAKVIKNGRIEPVQEYISEETYGSWMRRGLPRSGDVLITTEAPLGEVARVPADDRIALAQRVILLRPDPAKVDPAFFFHFLRSPEALARLRQRSSGTTVAGIRQPELKAVVIDLLDRQSQEMVGRILDALDDLIENNRRRVAVLEEMARAIYREWFVRFRYPGHEEVPLVDSPVGPIPNGWRLGSLRELATEVRRSVKPSADTAELPYLPIDAIDPRSLTVWGHRPGTEASSSLRLVSTGDVVFGAMRAYFHKVCVSPFNGVTRSTCFVLRPEPRHYWYAVLTLADTSTVAYAAAHSSGSTIPYAKWEGVLSEMPVTLPTASVSAAFAEQVQPLLEMAQNLADQVQPLASLRDRLLPKLVAGQIDVSHLDLGELTEAATA